MRGEHDKASLVSHASGLPLVASFFLAVLLTSSCVHAQVVFVKRSFL